MRGMGPTKRQASKDIVKSQEHKKHGEKAPNERQNWSQEPVLLGTRGRQGAGMPRRLRELDTFSADPQLVLL